jgi:hypothetical protein
MESWIFSVVYQFFSLIDDRALVKQKPNRPPQIEQWQENFNG